jgi:threonylcarbamoyladenosine tRNA methylthiotransferase MtaB
MQPLKFNPVRYSVITFGCRVNQADSLAIERDLRARGAVAATPSEADIVVVNTCSVTAAADQGARQTIRRVARDNPRVRVIVTGCSATRTPDDVAALPNVIRLITNGDKDRLVEEVAADIGLSTAARFGGGDGPCGAPLEPGVGGRTALTIRVQTGCEERCSYCIIPATRGASRSRTLNEVVHEITQAVAAGYKEIAISGVHLGSYGRDLSAKTSLVALVDRLADWPDDVLFRISSLEPMDCPHELIDRVAHSPRLAPHFHLPLQHGSDAVLRAMRRPYTAALYRRLIERIHEQMPHASIGSDMIVGFPGETDDDFSQTIALLRQLPLSHLHVFPYSDRPGTEASAMGSKVIGSAIRERGRELRQIGSELVRRFRLAQTGTTRRALTVDDGSSAVTDNYLKVPLSSPQPRNSWVAVAL